MCHAMHNCYLNSRVLAFPNGFFYGCTIANANVNDLTQTDYNSAWIFAETEQVKLQFRE